MTMDQQQPLEEPELSNRVIRGVDSLKALFTRYADPDMSSLRNRYGEWGIVIRMMVYHT